MDWYCYLNQPVHPTEVNGTQLLELLNTITTYIQQEEKAADKLTSPEVEQYQQEIARLQAQISALKSQLSQVEPQLGNAAAVMLSHEIFQDKVKELEYRNQEMESLLARNRPYQEEVEQLRQSRRQPEELAHTTTLSKSDQKMLEMQLLP
jgi:flagellar biosynthesis chaperone FliJ